MMLLIHGDNLTASRNYLNQLLVAAGQKNQEIVRLDGTKITLTDVKQALEAGSLFGQDKLIVVENLFSRLKSKEKEEIIDYVAKSSPTGNLYFWEAKIINLTTLKKFGPKLQIKLFKIPALIFQFLDAVWPGNQKTMLKSLKLLKSEQPELVFYLLCRRISQLIVAGDLGKAGLTKMAPWQQAKMLSQAQKFTLQQLTAFYQKLLTIDKQIKTGQTLAPLDYHLDLLIMAL